MPPDARRPRPLFTVLVGDDTLRHLCELADGRVVPPGALAAHLGNALLESVIFDGPSTVISVSRRRTFTGALRRAIEVRDRSCRHESVCDEPADRCDVDHIVMSSDGGPTSQFNGRLGCPPHNRHRHRRDNPSPLPFRTVDVLDEIRARLRWQFFHPPDDSDPPPP